jgi:uncharacterized protein (PEP-CTERM system associated)
MAITRPTRKSDARWSGRAGVSPTCRPGSRSAAISKRLVKYAATAAVTAAAVAASPLTHGESWRISPAISVESTLTDNVDLSPSSERKTDWVNQVTPSVSFTGTSARSRVAGSIALPILIYARDSNNDYIGPQVSIFGNLEAIEKFFFIEATANVSQQYLSPFGPRSTSLANATDNRYTSQAYTVSPYIQGVANDGITYELRQRSIWSDATGVSVGSSSNRTYTSNVNGFITREPKPAGASVEYARSDTRFDDAIDPDSRTETTEVVRLRGLYQVDPSLQVSLIGGYEENHFFTTQERGATYGAGVVWHPTDRTNLNATWEHRYFGASYHAVFEHRTPLSVWSINASRDVTSYPQQVAALTAGSDVNQLLNSLFSARVPDPAQRQQLVDQVIRDRGLPGQLTGPVSLFAQQLTLVESITATFGILGARNAIFSSIYHSRYEPAESSDEALRPLVPLLSNTTQNGVNVAWSHQLAPLITFVLNGDASRSTDNSGSGLSTHFYSTTATLSRTLSALTSAHAGARYQRALSDSSSGSNFREFAVFVGLTHTFR